MLKVKWKWTEGQLEMKLKSNVVYLMSLLGINEINKSPDWYKFFSSLPSRFFTFLNEFVCEPASRRKAIGVGPAASIESLWAPN